MSHISLTLENEKTHYFTFNMKYKGYEFPMSFDSVAQYNRYLDIIDKDWEWDGDEVGPSAKYFNDELRHSLIIQYQTRLNSIITVLDYMYKKYNRKVFTKIEIIKEFTEFFGTHIDEKPKYKNGTNLNGFYWPGVRRNFIEYTLKLEKLGAIKFDRDNGWSIEIMPRKAYKLPCGDIGYTIQKLHQNKFTLNKGDESPSPSDSDSDSEIDRLICKE